MARPRGADEGQNWVWAVCALLASLALAQRSYGTAFFDALFPAGDGQHRKESLKDAAATSRFDQSFVEPSDYDPPSDCVDLSDQCSGWARSGECEKAPDYMHVNCARSCRTCDTAAEQAKAAAAAAKLAAAAASATSGATGAAAAAVPAAAATADSNGFVCKDEQAACESWAKAGECENNPGYMRASCPVSCGTCEDVRTACDRVGQPAIADEPGGLNALFERIMTAPEFQRYNPTALSRAPWVISLDGFLQPEEGAAFVSSCNDSFSRSLAGDQLSPVRTSFQCWCSHAACIGHPHVQALTERVVALTGVPEGHAEYAQVIRYEPGQFYRNHHDQNSAPWTPQGVRLLTFFMYINDVEEGGGTRFTDLGITVQPKAGQAVLWPSVLDANLTRTEPKTHHEALAPVSGMKFGVNLWLHQFDFKTPSRKGCKWTSKNTFNG